MTLRPLAYWLLVCGLLLNSPLLFRDEEASSLLRWPLLLSAVILLVLQARTQRFIPSLPKDRVAWVLLGSIGTIAAPWPTWRIAFALLVVASCIPLGLPKLQFDCLRSALHTTGLMGVAVGLQQLVLPSVLARLHDLPWLPGLLTGTLSLAGIDADLGLTSVSLGAAMSSMEFTVSVEKLALGPALCFLVSAILAELNVGILAHPRRIAQLIFVWLAYVVIRLTVLCGLFGDGTSTTVFYAPWPVLVSFLPLALLWTALPGPLLGHDQIEARTHPHWRWFLLPLMGWTILTCGLRSRDPGIPKSGRILVDEGHSDWEWTDEALDTRAYGERTTYSYYSLFEFMRHYFPAVDRNYTSVDDDLLSQYDMLIIKMPTTPYVGGEVEAISRFVRNGGGLWLIGDHTNVFGTASCLNPVAEQFGVEFRWDAVDDLSMHGQQVFHPPSVGVHPITAWMPDMLMATSCSLDIEPGVEAVMLGDTLYADDARFQTYNFFGDRLIDGTERFGWFVQSASSQFGRGRVVAFTDSTTLSSFSFFLPGKWELALSTLNWLNRRNGSTWYFRLRSAAIALGALLILVSMRRHWHVGSPVMLAAAACGVILGLRVTDALVSWSYPLPKPLSDPAVLAFETQRSGVRFPVDHPTHEWDEDNLHTFAVWTQRLGLVPRVTASLNDGLRHDALVLAWPRGLTDQECRRIHAFVQDGGKLLVLDDAFDSNSDSNLLLDSFGLSFADPLGHTVIRLDGIASYGPEHTLQLPTARTVRGGESFLTTKDGIAIGSALAVGEGQVVAIGIGRSFSVDRLGTTDVVPDFTQLALAEIEYYILRDVLRLRSLPPSGSSQDRGKRRTQ